MLIKLGVDVSECSSQVAVRDTGETQPITGMKLGKRCRKKDFAVGIHCCRTCHRDRSDYTTSWRSLFPQSKYYFGH